MCDITSYPLKINVDIGILYEVKKISRKNQKRKQLLFHYLGLHQKSPHWPGSSRPWRYCFVVVVIICVTFSLCIYFLRLLNGFINQKIEAQVWSNPLDIQEIMRAKTHHYAYVSEERRLKDLKKEISHWPLRPAPNSLVTSWTMKMLP